MMITAIHAKSPGQPVVLVLALGRGKRFVASVDAVRKRRALQEPVGLGASIAKSGHSGPSPTGSWSNTTVLEHTLFGCNDRAGQAWPRVAGGLGRVIVRVPVNDQSFADDVVGRAAHANATRLEAEGGLASAIGGQAG